MASSTLAPALRDSARIVAAVAAGRSLADAFDDAASASESRAALIDLTHATLRMYGRVHALVAALSQRGKPHPLVEALLWCALAALDSGRYAAYTVVDQAVRACVLLNRENAKGYVNALLRAFLRERASLDARLARDAQAEWRHPAWWIELVRAGYPEAWQTVLQQGNTHPPMCLRVNARRTTREAYRAQLEASGMASAPIGAAGLLLAQPVPVERLPGFAAGEVSVQDAGAQRAAACLDLCDGQRVLDACAAPGGKSAHILETAGVSLTALDSDAARLERLRRNLERLGLQARLARGDAARPADWWDAGPFDRILADVPCSASGVARRYPDLKWLRRRADVDAFAERQARLLDALWRTLRAGGKLLYVTCSVFPQENGAVIDAFAARTGNALRLPLPDALPGQWLPEAEHDGFFYALIQKTD